MTFDLNAMQLVVLMFQFYCSEKHEGMLNCNNQWLQHYNKALVKLSFGFLHLCKLGLLDKLGLLQVLVELTQSGQSAFSHHFENLPSACIGLLLLSEETCDKHPN